MNHLLFEPLKYYEQEARDRHRQNLEDHYEALRVSAGVNEEENRETVKKYKAKLAEGEAQRRVISKFRLLRTLVIVAAVIVGICALIGVISSGIPLLAIPALLVVGGAVFLSVFLIKKKINPRLAEEQEKLEKLVDEAQKLLDEAAAQMAPLNALFCDEDTLRLIEGTMPELNFDSRFTVGRLSKMVQDYDYVRYDNDNVSIIDTLSGELLGSPFLFERQYKMTMGTATYHGTLTISWTETYTDSKGNLRTRHRTQTLHASLEKPKPYYSSDTHLGYGSLVAPDLTFSRQPSHTEDLSESQRERKVRRGAKKLKDKAEDALLEGGTFQEMANSEFDVLFGATNRNHEVQFRLMFTPLAQKNILDLITSETGYGDDFAFYKRKKYNIVRSEHSQSWVMRPSASRYRSYDIDASRSEFIRFNEEYFKSVFFDIAPLLAVPAYQEEPADSMKVPVGFSSFYSPEEHEVMANAIGADYFKHPTSATDAILKTEHIASEGRVDRVRVTARSFFTEQRLDYVPTLGGDGGIHAVPVYWTEYLPIEKETDMVLSAVDVETNEFESRRASASAPDFTAYLHGLMAYPVGDKTSMQNIKDIFNKFYNK